MLNTTLMDQSKQHLAFDATDADENLIVREQELAKAVKKFAAVRCGNSVLWLDPKLDLLPQKEDIKRRHHQLTRSGYDKKIRPRRVKTFDYVS